MGFPIILQKNESKKSMENSVIFGDLCWWWAPEGLKFAFNSCCWRSCGRQSFLPTSPLILSDFNEITHGVASFSHEGPRHLDKFLLNEFISLSDGKNKPFIAP